MKPHERFLVFSVVGFLFEGSVPLRGLNLGALSSYLKVRRLPQTLGPSTKCEQHLLWTVSSAKGLAISTACTENPTFGSSPIESELAIL